MATWTYLLADLRTNLITAEVPLSQVSITRKLNDSGTLNATWQLTEDTAGSPYLLTTPCRTVVYALRDGSPMWGGIIWTRQYDSTSGQVTIGAADWWSYWDHRKVVPLLDTTHGLSTLPNQQIAFASWDLNDIARYFVTLAQSHTGGNIGVQVDTTTSGAISARTYYGYQVTAAGDELRSLTTALGGPDIMFGVASLDSHGRPQRIMRTGTPKIGQQGSPWVWEVGGNALAYTWPSDGTRMASREYAVGSGINEGTPIAISEDTGLYTDGWALLEDQQSYSSLDDPTLLLPQADSNLAAARLPVVIPTLVVNGQMSPRIGEYTVGDDCRLIVPPGDLFHRAGLDTRMRIIGDTIDPSDATEPVTLTLNPLTVGVM